MFVYEKRLIDKATGQANDTLNITFEGNKPVENPEVVITKDGVIGIKSDSNAYGIRIESTRISIDRYTINGEITDFDSHNGNSVLGFTKSFGFNVLSHETTDISEFNICAVRENGEFVFEPVSINENIPNISYDGEYVIDMENKIIYFPSSSPVKSYDLSTYLSQFKNVFGFVIGYYGG